MNRRKEVDSLLVTKVNVVAEQEDEDEFAHIFLLLIAIHPVPCEGVRVCDFVTMCQCELSELCKLLLQLSSVRV